MERKGVYFNGRFITHPGAYSKTDAEGMVGKTEGYTKILALIGTCEGGQPGEILWFDDPSVAKQVLKAGDLLKAAEKSWSPTGVGGGADLIATIRANKATKATLNAGDGHAVSASVGTPDAADANTSTGTVSAGGTFSGTADAVYTVQIDAAGTQTTGTFKWKKDGGSWTEDVTCGSSVSLSSGVTVTFGSGNYVLSDSWTIACIAAKSQTVTALISSKDWGFRNNAIEAKLQDGTKTGSKKLSIYEAISQVYEIFDNIGEMFTVQYAGTETYAAIQIAASSVDHKAATVKTKKGSSQESATDDIVIDLSLAKFSTIQSIVNEINSHANYTAKLISGVPYSKFTPRDLDILAGSSIKSEFLVTGVKADLVQLSNYSKYVDISILDWSGGIPANFAYTALTGGSEGDVPASWVEYLDKLSGVDVTKVVPLTGETSIHAETLAHVVYATNSLNKERSCAVGGYAGETKEDQQERALILNSDRAQIAYPGFYDYDVNEEKVLYPPYITAAMYAGRQTSKDFGESCTFDYFSIVEPEFYISPEDVNDLLNSGVAPLEFVQKKGTRLAQDITTYLTDSNSLYVERCLGEYADYLNSTIRVALEPFFIGKGAKLGRLSSIKNKVISVLKDELRAERITAYDDNIQITFSDRVVKLEYSVAPTEPINFIMITSHFYLQDLTV